MFLYGSLVTTIADWCHWYVLGQVTIDMLPDDALLEIFDFFLCGIERTDGWDLLVHVCRKWRNVVFGSPRRLNLHLQCTARKPVREMLDVWPELPIVMEQHDPPTLGVDNIVAALEHSDRVCEITLRHISSSLWENILAATKVPFPALTRLDLVSEDETMPDVPDSFLGGSAPLLRSLHLRRIPFPGLPRLLSSTVVVDLVHLELYDIPHSGYISPEAMVTCLSALTNLEALSLDFQSPRSRPDGRRCLRPPTRSLLPRLIRFAFKGVSEYLEDLVARIDAPFLDELHIIFFHQLILDTPQLAQFIGRTPNLKAHNEAQVTFLDDAVQVLLGYMQHVSLRTACKASDWQLSFVAQVCSSSLSLIPSLEHLYICAGEYSRSHWLDDVENSQWLDILHPFTAVKNLYLSKEVAPRIVSALQEVIGDGVTDVLPVLENLFLEEPHLSGTIQETIEKLVASRLYSNHPIAISHWDRDQHKW